MLEPVSLANDWNGLACVGWIGWLGLVGLGRFGPGWIKLDWTGLEWNGLAKTGMSWIRIGRLD